jgi:hypothetical protein
MIIKAVPALCRFGMAGALLIAAFFAANVAPGQEPESSTQRSAESQESANKRQLAAMRTLAETIQVTVGDGEKGKAAKLIAGPLLRFSDPSRTYSHGSVWAWTVGGRPVMMAEFRSEDRDSGVWGHDIVATSDVRLSAEIADHGRFAPKEPDFKLLAARDLASPAKTEAGRLRQMKQFARSLSASEIRRGQRYELRLLPTEVHRYSDAASGLVDGGAFVFVVGNNPEAILFVEAHRSETGDLSWKYGLARMTAASLTFLLNNVEVWGVPGDYGGPRASYYVFARSVPGRLDAGVK